MLIHRCINEHCKYFNRQCEGQPTAQFCKCGDAFEVFEEKDIESIAVDALVEAERLSKLNAILMEALREGTGHDRMIEDMRALARRCETPLIGGDREAAAQIINEYARFIRVARSTLAKAEGHSMEDFDVRR